MLPSAPHDRPLPRFVQLACGRRGTSARIAARKWPRHDSVSEIAQEDIERVTGGSVRHTFPSNYRLAVDAMNKGKPLVIENHNKLAASFVGFAKALAGVTPAPESSETRSGLLGRLTGRR